MSTDLVERGGLPAATAIPEDARMLRPLMKADEADQLWKLATALSLSGAFKNLEDAKLAYAKILIGRDLGLSPTQSMMTLDLVKGNIFMRGVLLAGFVRQSRTYHYKILERTNTKCRLQFLGYPSDEQEEGFIRSAGKWWEVLSEEEYTIEDAKRAKLIKEDGAWIAHPKNMLFWRCISNGVKMNAPDLLGGMPVYTEADVIESTAETVTDGGLPAGGPEPISPEAIWERLRETADLALVERLQGLTEGWPAARLEMTLAGRSASGLVDLADQLEAQAAVEKKEGEQDDAGEEVTPDPGDVINEDADADPVEPPTEEPLDERMEGDDGPSEEILEQLEVLRRREEIIADSMEGLDMMDPRYQNAIAEMEQIREEIQMLGGGTGDVAF